MGRTCQKNEPTVFLLINNLESHQILKTVSIQNICYQQAGLVHGKLLIKINLILKRNMLIKLNCWLLLIMLNLNMNFCKCHLLMRKVKKVRKKKNDRFVESELFYVLILKIKNFLKYFYLLIDY